IVLRTQYLGRYQLRAVERVGAFTFDTAGVSNRLITPNGDGLNDSVVFTFDNPRDSAVSGKIFDLKGARVADMFPGPVADSLEWDARGGGQVVPGGVYIYQIEAEDSVSNGTVVVIR
ncbi:MAG: gliding motility-associated C-terminal domain-containing protein, partial [Elusimicrobiota bacterium]